MATYYKGDGTQITIPSASSVDTAQLVDNAVTYNKLAEAVQDQLDSVESIETEIADVEETLDSLSDGQLTVLTSPLVATTASEMTNTKKTYVYTGSESGYTKGNWYYYNGSSWVSGGVYNAVAIQTDTTLSVSGMPADAMAVKNAINNVQNELDEYSDIFTGDVDESVQNWLDEHPEATTTVVDGSLTEAKFTEPLKLKTIKDYVTPEMYGAKGDGVTDDTNSIQNALNSGYPVYIPEGTYLVTGVTIPNKRIVFGDGRNTIIQGDGTNHTIIIPSSSSYCELRSLNVNGTNGNENYNAIEVADKSSEDAEEVYDASHVIDDVKIMYGNYGLRIGTSVRGCIVNNITASNATNDGLHIDGTDNTVKNGGTYLCGGHGLYITQNNRIKSFKPFANDGYGIYIEAHYNNLVNIDIQQTTGSGIFVGGSNNYIQFVADGVGWRNTDYNADISLIVLGNTTLNMICGTIRNGTLQGMMNHILSVEPDAHPFDNIIDVTYAEAWNRFPLQDVCAVNGILDPSNTYKVNGRRIYSDFNLYIPSNVQLSYRNVGGSWINTTPIDFDTFGTSLSVSNTNFTFDSLAVGLALDARFALETPVTAKHVYVRAYVTSNADITQNLGYAIASYDGSARFAVPNYLGSKPSDGYIEGYFVFNADTQISGIRIGLAKFANETITTPTTLELTVKEVEIWAKK